jgi:hypothetical protein
LYALLPLELTIVTVTVFAEGAGVDGVGFVGVDEYDDPPPQPQIPTATPIATAAPPTSRECMRFPPKS